jgi:Eisosome component PIL1
LTNITRQKFREAYTVHLAAVLERSEKQALLAKQAQKLIQLLDDSPIVPGQERAAFGRHEEVRDVINDAEAELRAWTPSWQSTGHEAAGSTQAQDESSAISTATGEGHTNDGTHLAEVTSAPPTTQTHADLHHDPTAAASTSATAGVPSEAGYTEGSQAHTASVEQPHAV